MPLISAKHPSTPHQSHSQSQTQTGSAVPPPIPSIRLISATPSSSGLSSSADGSRSMSLTLEESWAASLASLPVPPSALGSSNSGFTSNVSLLAPKDKENGSTKGQEGNAKKKLVPKKSKLSILGLGSSSAFSAGKDKYSGRDFSDVVRRVGAAEQLPSGLSSASMNLKGGFEIYVDPTDDPDIGEIVMIKKKKSRAGLDGVRWGGGAGGGGGSPLQEVGPSFNENVPKPKEEGVPKKESKDVLLKPPSLNGEGGKENVKEAGKENAKGGWWATIGRGRKDSKEDKENKKREKEKENKISHKPVEYIHEPHPRSKTPDPFKPSSISKGTSKDGSTSRGRFNSLGSTFLLGGSSQSRAPTPIQDAPQGPTYNANANTNSVRGLQAYTKQAKSSLPPLSQFSSYGQPSIVPMPMDDDEDDAPRPTLARSSTAPLPEVAMDVDRDMDRERTYSRSTTPTFGGFLAPPNMTGVPSGQGQTQGSAQAQGQTQNGQGSIALRAIRSVRSLARMGSWAQLKNMPAPEDAALGDEATGTIKEKKSKKSKSSKDKENANAGDVGEEKTKKKKSVKKEKDGKEKEKTDKKTKKEKKTKEEKEKLKPKAATLRMSSSSFEIGALTASPGPAPAAPAGYASSTYDASPMQSRTLGPSSGLGATLQVGAGISNQPPAVGKKQSTLFGGLGLGLPSSMRLQSVRMGSSASSKYEVPSGQSASLGGGLMPAAVITEKVKENSKEKGDTRTPMGSLRKPTDPSEVIANIINSNRLSVESARLAQLGTHPSSSSVNLVPNANVNANQNRASSIISSGSSLRPISTSSMGSGMDRRLSSASGCSRLSAISAGGASALSGVSGVSAGSAATGASGGSVRWDEEGLESARAARRKERAEREKGMSRQERQERRASRESRRSAEGRRRTPIMSVFPELDPGNGGAEGEKMDVDDVEMRDADAYGGMEEDEEDVDDRRQRGFEYPILTIEEATSDGHGAVCDSDDDDAGDAGEVVARGGKGGEAGKEAKKEKKTQAETPVKKARARPLSEQMLGKSRPRAMHEDDHDEGVLSILDAATNDLAQLINNLDLQATPCSTPGQTPLRPSPFGTPNVGASPTPVSTLEKPGPGASLSKANVKKARGGVADSPLGLKSAKKAGVSAWVLAQSQGRAQGAMLKREESTASISSLRPYAQSRAAHTATVTTKSLMGSGGSNTIGSSAGNSANAPNAMKIGQQIAPWATLIKNLSPAKDKKSPLSKENHANQATIRAKPSSPPATISAGSSSAWRPGHKRTMTPAPEPEPEPVLQPLKPARTKAVFAKGKLVQIPPLVVQKKEKEKETSQKEDQDKDRAPSSLTFGEKSAASVAGGASESGSLTPVFKRIQEYEMFAQKSSLGPNDVLGLGAGGSRASSRAPSSRSGSKGSRSSYGSVLPRSTLQDGINASFSLNFANDHDNDNDNQSDADEDWKSLTQFKNRDLNNSIARETRKALGMSGTMGGSDVSRYGANEPLDVSDPDSDVPDELRVILKESEETQARRLSALQDSPGYSASCSEESYDYDHVQAEFGGRSQLASDSGLPPSLAFELDLQLPSAPPASLPPPPPVFRAALVDEQDNHLGLDLDDFSLNSPTSEEDTKKSFDFTGELKKLNESGGSDRRSFVEQLENAFRTPAKVDLRYDLSFGALGLGKVGGGGQEKSVVLEVPPVPELPVDLRRKMELSRDSETSASSDESRAEESTDASKSSSEFGGLSSGSRSQLVDLKLPNMTTMEKTRSEEVQGDDSKENSDNNSHFDMFSTSRIVDVKEPTVLQASDSSQDSNIPQERILKPSLASSTSSRSSEGELNTSFRFGGLPRSESSASMPMPREKKDEKELTLSDIIPPPSHVRSLSGMDSYMLDGLEDDSVLKSIYTQMIGGLPGQRPRVNSDSSTQQSAEDKRQSIYKAASRPVSGVSFQGFDSFEEVRRGFEFSGERQPFYPPAAAAAAAAASRRPHRRHESVFSIASVSSYGHVINPGSTDPFDYGLPSLRERPSSEDMSSISMSMSIDDTFAFMRDRPARRRVESDASSFYFRALQARGGGHRRRESNMSVSSQAPPISLYNRGFAAAGHRRNDSSASTSSVAMSYVKHGANGGISAWARHRKDQSFDSIASDFSAMHLGRPGLGDKMFDMQAPLTSISASPPESVSASQENFDSIMDAYAEQKSSVDDSLFDKTGHRNSASSESVFGDDYSHSYQNGLLPPNHFRPLSILSRGSVHSPGREDDTMISMLGGGHVRRRSIGSIIEASPCVRVEKRKHSAVQNTKAKDHYESPNKARIVEKPSIASSHMFGGERMIKAQHGLLERQSLEESVLIAEGEDLSGYVPVFSRPAPTTRSRSSTCTSSSGGDTPPLSASDGSSISGGSQSSIDLASINIALANATHPVSTLNNMNRSRARAPGTGHRRRYSKANVSRSSVYETIEEENPGSNQTSPAHSVLSKKSSPTTRQAIFIVDSDTASIQSGHEESTVWDDERGIVALRRYYALRDEAHETVTESRRQWRDTPFSLFAVQTFQAPGSPSGMQAMLEHSVQNYGPLPSELRPRRVRTSSRPSPYPQRSAKSTMSPEKTRSSFADLNKSSFAELNKTSFADLNKASFANLNKTPVLQPINPNKNIMAAAPSLEAFKPFSPLVVDIEPKQEKAFGAPREARPRVGSNARRTALGWSKRSTGKSSTDQKENAGGSGMVMTPGENLRLNRPRPRGRPTPGGRTPATQARPIRI